MFSEAYIVFSSGQIGVFQQVMWPECYVTITDCPYDMIKHVASYVLICGIMAGELLRLWPVLGLPCRSPHPGKRDLFVFHHHHHHLLPCAGAG
jgi:hypothetical protein